MRDNTLTKYDGVDIMKWLISFSVIAIHAPEYLYPMDRTYPTLMSWFIRLAVPFFFVTSGFLIQHNLNGISAPKDRRYYLLFRSINLLRIWFCWVVIYIPLSLWGITRSSDGLITENIEVYLLNLFLTGQPLYAHQLWFLYSMAAVTLLWAISATDNPKKLFLLFCLFTVMAYLPLNNNLFYQKLLVFFWGGGAPIMAGAILNILLRKYFLSKAFIFILFLSSFCLYYFDLPMSHLFGGCGLFLLGYVIHPKMKLHYKSLRVQSMYIYYTHMYVVIIIMICLRKFDIEVNKYTILFIVCGATWAIAWGINKLSQFPQFRILGSLVK